MLSRLTRFAKAGLALTAAAVALGAFAAAGSAAPKPGFLPGTWIGQGTISGSVDDGPMSAFFNGRISFTMKVGKSLGVSGTGTWKLDMLGSQDAPSEYGVDATIVGAANDRPEGHGHERHVLRNATDADAVPDRRPDEARSRDGEAAQRSSRHHAGRQVPGRRGDGDPARGDAELEREAQGQRHLQRLIVSQSEGAAAAAVAPSPFRRQRQPARRARRAGTARCVTPRPRQRPPACRRRSPRRPPRRPRGRGRRSSRPA